MILCIKQVSYSKNQPVVQSVRAKIIAYTTIPYIHHHLINLPFRSGVCCTYLNSIFIFYLIFFTNLLILLKNSSEINTFNIKYNSFILTLVMTVELSRPVQVCCGVIYVCSALIT